MAKPIKTEWHNEDRIEAAFREWLTRHGWQVESRSAPTGADIAAIDSKGQRWVIEVKGYPSTYFKRDGSPKSARSIRTQRRIWFIEGLGQLLTRMTSPDIRFGVLFPDHPSDRYFETQAQNLTQHVRVNLGLWVFLLSQRGVVRVLRPEGQAFEAWPDDGGVKNPGVSG